MHNVFPFHSITGHMRVTHHSREEKVQSCSIRLRKLHGILCNRSSVTKGLNGILHDLANGRRPIGLGGLEVRFGRFTNNQVVHHETLEFRMCHRE
jgi:hypothetical protein